MLISWIKKTTLLDYPWKVACIIFTAWCNMRCSFCYNSEFVLESEIRKQKDFIPAEVFFNFLRTRIWILEWVVICWWEPTVHKDLFEFCQQIKEMWFLVKLDTNWMNFKALKNLIDENLIDYVAMDIKNSLEKYSKTIQVEASLEDIQKSIDLIKNSWIDHEFRTTVVKWIHQEEDFEEIWKLLPSESKYYLQNFKKWPTLVKVWFAHAHI